MKVRFEISRLPGLMPKTLTRFPDMLGNDARFPGSGRYTSTTIAYGGEVVKTSPFRAGLKHVKKKGMHDADLGWSEPGFATPKS